jgi:hypothetical protein
MSATVFGQGAIKKTRHLSDKVFFGGGMGLQFVNITAVEFNPMVGYVPVENLYIGTKGSYLFYKDNRIDGAATQIFGGSLFAMYNIAEKVALYTEYEAISLETNYFTDLQRITDKDRYWIHSPLAGLGFIQPLSERSKLVILVLWSFNQKAYAPYQNPTVRFMFMI